MPCASVSVWSLVDLVWCVVHSVAPSARFPDHDSKGYSGTRDALHYFMLEYVKGQGWIDESVHELVFSDFRIINRTPVVGEKFTYVAADDKHPNGWIVDGKLNEVKFREWNINNTYKYFTMLFDGDLVNNANIDRVTRKHWAEKGLTVYYLTILPL